ncbi:MAG TPA: ANTAR domain-containing protein [Caldimonas sp.]|nr:ANTAR domain-containing protein [Caldimonas sp.]HEX2539476.1 ANTAR domain-containing protein [Caldimonas sp.]
MTTALVVEGASPAGVDLAADLAKAGIHVVGAVPRNKLVRQALELGPDVVVCHEDAPDAALFEAFALLAGAAPCPVVVFTHDPEASRIEQATRAGVHAYVVNGYGEHRLRAVLHVAQSRFQHERRLRADLDDVTRRFEERKLVDRAKGILMRARHVSEEQAFGVLRAASMHSNQRVGEVSRQVITAAHYADAVNRAGKLRMLSQRLVKLHALQLLEPASPTWGARLAQAAEEIEATIRLLGKSLSRPTFGDLLDAVAGAWMEAQALLALPASTRRVPQVDALAERLLGQADQLTRQLERAGLVTTLHVINLSGRHRMLCQRHAKQILLRLLLGGGDGNGAGHAELAQTAASFEEALAQLRAAPLSTPEIRVLLQDADAAWADVSRAARQVHARHGARALDEASEVVLGVVEQLTDRYEHSMQVLMG